MTSHNERNQILDSIDRLLAGTPQRSDGALTIVSLAIEANVKRHVLTHRHTDLKEQFYARVRAQGHIPESEQKLRTQLQQTQESLTTARDEIRNLTQTNETFARIINVLTLENNELRTTDRTVIPIHRRQTEGDH